MDLLETNYIIQEGDNTYCFNLVVPVSYGALVIPRKVRTSQVPTGVFRLVSYISNLCWVPTWAQNIKLIPLWIIRTN